MPEPFDHPEFIFEAKLDGFRALAHIRGHRCDLVSRNGHTFKQWPQLSEEITHAVRARSAVLDSEICCLEPDGRTHFNWRPFAMQPVQPDTSYSLDRLGRRGAQLSATVRSPGQSALDDR